MNPEVTTPPIINYDGEGSYVYRTDFWDGRRRDYEDRVERIALERLLQPAQGKRLLELGAGFGRLSEFYSGYEQVILLDYSKSQLEEARARLGDDKYIYVAADIYRLPIADGVCDAATMIRVLHHFADVPAALAKIRAALSPGAVFVLEYANKRNLKAMLRFALRRQAWSPYTQDPIEFYKLHFDFHPRYIQQALQGADFDHQRSIPVSYFRLGLFKKLMPTAWLVYLDALMQRSGLLYSPSIFTQNTTPGERHARLSDVIFRCPDCKNTALRQSDDKLICEHCGKGWSTENGIYDFREPV